MVILEFLYDDTERKFLLSQYAETGKLEQELFLAGILESDMCLGVFSRALHLEYLTYPKAFVLDKLPRRELCHTAGSLHSSGRH